MDDGVIIVSANYDVQHFCFAALSRMFSLSLADSWICCDSLLLSYPARLLIIDFDLLHPEPMLLLSFNIQTVLDNYSHGAKVPL